MIQISKELLNGILKMFENYEEALDGEFGECREAEEIIADGHMPNIYYELQSILDEEDTSGNAS